MNLAGYAGSAVAAATGRGFKSRRPEFLDFVQKHYADLSTPLSLLPVTFI